METSISSGKGHKYSSAPRYHVPSAFDHNAIAAHFIGPKCENMDIMMNAINYIFRRQQEHRHSYHDEDPVFITEDMKSSQTFKDAKELLESKLTNLTELLIDHSIPFFSPRYSAHMCMEMTMPAMLGYIATMIYNPNNVAFEASPLTTYLEIVSGKQMSEMLGYNVDIENTEVPTAWGHIACDGSVGNLEAVWAARNLKYYPFSVLSAMEDPLAFISTSFEVETCSGQTKLFSTLDTWELFNLKPSTILEIPGRLSKQYGISPTYLNKIMKEYSIQTVSKDYLERKWNIDEETTPQILTSFTKHYSWPKACAIAGIGSVNAIGVAVDNEARMDVTDLRKKLEYSYQNKRPIYAVVAVMGTTEEGAVDPLGEILDIRSEYQEKGMSFLVLADAAWGGYFTSMIREPPSGSDKGIERHKPESGTGTVPHVALRANTVAQLERLKDADSITIDPHKSGYVPYPAGGLCYRDGRMRYLLSWTAPVLHQGTTDSIGTYGVEGSKPGAAAAAVWMNHEVVGLHKDGMGVLLGEAAFTCRRFSGHWTAMSTDDDCFVIRSLNLLPSERDADPDPVKIEEERKYIRENILFKSNSEIAADPKAMELLNQLGSDLNINAFTCNFRHRDGTLNEDVDEANYLNRRIFERLSATNPDEDPRDTPLYITSTTFMQDEYGKCATNFKKRLGLNGDQDLFVLRNVVMSPFSTEGDYMHTLIKVFREILEDEVENVRKRNENLADTHTFLMQGQESLHLVHLPHFHKATGQYQLITTAAIPQEHMRRYQDAKQKDSSLPIFLRNTRPATLQNFIDQKSFEATVSFDGGKTFSSDPFSVSNVEVVQFHSIANKAQSAAYPREFSPFYLYGSANEQHIDHMLLLDPNAQLSAANVDLNLDPPIASEKYGSGLTLLMDGIHEESMQPFPTEADRAKFNFFFAPERQFQVSVYDDALFRDARDPIDFERLTKPISKGTMKLGKDIFIDTENLNYENMVEPIPFRYSGDLMNLESKEQWVSKVHDRLGVTA